MGRPIYQHPHAQQGSIGPNNSTLTQIQQMLEKIMVQQQQNHQHLQYMQ